MHLPRRILPALVAMSGIALLAGCSTAAPKASPSPSSSASASTATSTAPLACPASGSASDAVKVTASKSGAPKVTFPTPTTVSSTQRSTIESGSGAEAKQGDSVTLAYSMYDAKSGKEIDSRGWSSSSRQVFPVDGAQVLPGFAEAVVCAKEGDLVATVIPASKAFGTAGSEQIGVAGGDSIVFVAKIYGHSPTKATGAAKALPSGFPKVTLAANGAPTVKIPATDPPKELKIAASKVGTGQTVKSGDSVTVQYQGVLWRTGEIFDQSWGKSPTTFATTQVVKGFGDALVGQKVGSQVVAIIPPKDGYGTTGSQDGTIKGTDTMVFVIDILADSRG
ncbi:FKBP-type peptidyl-prolyl cis-trans isomerase [Amnibacterium kyonggiense]|uniref:FKBP-type peptidyl-prolyl cis-trans isomerase n=1 Tax=Amnibacterium kyonggiense TaxID=595671 RepID=UPI0013C307FC|nr:FKBP-type peptidyl-prolyl cis-trans isomerase [Amnibacterium kyonggiense]